MNDLPSSYSCQVSIALVGKDYRLRPRPLQPGCDRWPPAVEGHDYITVKLAPVSNRAPRRGNADCPSRDIKLIHYLGHEPVDRPVRATGAVRKWDIRHGCGPLEDNLHALRPTH